MRGEIWEPVARWRDELRDKHAANVDARFEALLLKSGVDAGENRKTVGAVKALETALAAARRLLRRLGAAAALCRAAFWAAVLAAVAYAVVAAIALWNGETPPKPPPEAVAAVLAAGSAAGLLWRKVFAPKAEKAAANVAGLDAKLREETEKAWGQMAPLNALFDWSIPAEIAHETLPSLEIDPVFSVGRLQDLKRTFGLDDAILGERSVVGTASGEIAGSPFVLADAISQKWGEQTYSGSKTIHWTERVRDPDGKWRIVTRSETLVASVTKPVPVFERGKFLLFGNPAAPDLRFSRSPSPLSGKDPEAKSTRRAMEREERHLEALARRLDPSRPFTMVANHDFEVLFHAIDRDHPVQFRLLYTPLAQQQTVALLRDREQGWGDDFSLRKDRMVTLVDAEHLSDAEVETPPSRYASYDLDDIRAKFVSFCNEWFKHMYFALAPVLCVPLYQQTRTHEAIHRTDADRAAAAPELESVANAFGEERFAHPRCATHSLLKVSVSRREGGKTAATVSAHGFSAEERVEIVQKWGGDGHCHDIEVPWTEYLPVVRETPMSVLDATKRPRAYAPDADPPAAEAWRSALLQWAGAGAKVFGHRATVSRFG